MKKIILTLFVTYFIPSTCKADLGLIKCVEENTKHLQSYTNRDLDEFRIFCTRKKIGQDAIEFIYKKGTWTFLPIGKNPQKCFIEYAKFLVKKLNSLPTQNLKEGLSFYYFNQEPIHAWRGSIKHAKKLTELIARFPFCITCTHPWLEWTQKGVLFPDWTILTDQYKKDIDFVKHNSHKKFAERKSIIFFRGAISSPYTCDLTLETAKLNERIRLMFLSKDMPFIDAAITSISWRNPQNEKEKKFTEWADKTLVEFVKKKAPYSDQTDCKYLITMDGFGAAFPRVQQFLFSGSILLLRADCKQYFYPLLKNDENCMIIEPELKNLSKVFHYLENNPKHAVKIAENGKKLAEHYLTPEAIDQYIMLLITQLNSLYQPSSTTTDKLKDWANKIRIWLGIL